jgi:hypothetical protein
MIKRVRGLYVDLVLKEREMTTQKGPGMIEPLIFISLRS